MSMVPLAMWFSRMKNSIVSWTLEDVRRIEPENLRGDSCFSG